MTFERRSLSWLAAVALVGACDASTPPDGGPRADAGSRAEDGGSALPDAALPLDDAGSSRMLDAGLDAGNSCPRVRVTTVGTTLNVRAAPTLDAEVRGTLAEGEIVQVLDTVSGDDVDGVRTWHEIEAPHVTGFVTGRFTECTTDDRPLRPPGFLLPLECGTSARISQGNNSGFSHTGYSAYAFDFALARGTTLHAMDDGVVAYVYDATGPGDPCYDGGGPECIDAANMVWLRHADGSVTSYAHLDAVLVSRGASVTSGTPIGRSGSSGYSTGPHAHVARQTDCTSVGCPSIPLAFADVPGDGVPETDDIVTSGNCY